MNAEIIIGDCRDHLANLKDLSFNTCVTSIPYFGLRDYQTGVWEGGDAGCAHTITTGRQGETGCRRNRSHTQQRISRGACRCGAVRIDRQLGLEPTPEEFVAGMVEVFRQVRRVLRDDGTLWLNIGDSYCSRPNGSIGKESRLEGAFTSHSEFRRAHALRKPGLYDGIKHKDLIGIPWMLAFALRADGWFLRQENIWWKTNAMPESVTDRCTKAHESVFLLTKSERYYYDQEAIREPASPNTHARMAQKIEDQDGSFRAQGRDGRPLKAVGRRAPEMASRIKANTDFLSSISGQVVGSVNKRSVWPVETVPFDLNMCGACKQIYPLTAYRKLRVEKVTRESVVVERRVHCGCGRWDSWVSHFATFPPRLIEPCILAGAPVGGAVLDPFGGGGTTGLVAQRLGRRATLIELNPDYAAMADYRCRAGNVGLPLGSAA